MMVVFQILVFLIGLFYPGYTSDPEVSSGIHLEKEETIRILFAGDIMGHKPQITSAHDPATGTYNYMPVFEHIAPYLKSADFAVCNLEVTLAGAPYDGYPQFSSPDALATALVESGFNVIVTANNHSVDRGKKGLIRTLNVLDTLPVLKTGTFRNSFERDSLYPLIIESKGARIALLNYTYGTNGIPVEQPVIVNLIDTIQIKLDIAKAKEREANYVITTIHWGLEYQLKESKEQRLITDFLFRNGSDIIIGSHPHVVQPVELRSRNENDSSNYHLVVYSLGNFVSNQRDRYRDGGIIIGIDLQVLENKISLKSVDYLPVWVHKPLVNGKYHYHLLPADTLPAIMNTYPLDEADKKKYMEFFHDTGSQLKNVSMSTFFREQP
jgi:poly-gamma-glutamate capsule biosynthesis protein CapA/YwtB (metallophosphatase superfamily)